MIKKIFRLLTLKPYGDHLSDGVVEIWLFFAMLNIAAVAFCDALAWAYLGYTTATGWAAYAAAAIAGGIALTIIGSLDATFIMHDTSHERRIEPQPAKTGWLHTKINRTHLAVAVRIL